MKKLLLSAAGFLSIITTINAQQIQPCGTYQAREIALKNVPGYAAKLNVAEAAAVAEYQAFLQSSNAAAKTSSLSPSYNFTVPVVFHVLHLGEAPGTGSNVDDQLAIDALAQVNRDFARQNSDTATIDPLFDPLYVNSKIEFILARKDPKGNCTSGIVHHYDPKTNWAQADIFNFQYSTMAAGNWNPSKYLNIYIVKDIIGSSIGTIVGYTYLPGTSPIDPADAIVYRNDFLMGSNARSLSHEIGHWMGLSHTFGSTNEPGLECSNDDIKDTPKTTGFFSTCPKPATFAVIPTVSNPVDSSDIIKVRFGGMRNTTAINSLTGYLVRPILSLTGTAPTIDTAKSNETAAGVAGAYSDFSRFYGNDFNGGTTNTISVTSVASYTSGNNVGVYIDFNNNGTFGDPGDYVYAPATALFGTKTFSSTVVIPASTYGLIRMRVITSDLPITGPTMNPNSGEVEDYILNIGTTPSPTTGVNRTMASCDTIRPNIENIMDYSGCPKMFTKGQTDKMRLSASSPIGNRDVLTSDLNLYNSGLYNTITLTTFTVAPTPPSTVVTTYTAWVASNPSTVTPCAPVADFAANKVMTCSGQAITYVSTSYNSTPSSYSWVFEGGSPSTSTLATQSVTYATPGTYSVSLTVSNAEGVSTKTVSSYVSVKWNQDRILPYSENFESGQWWPQGWTMINENFGTPSWELSNYGAGPLSNSYKSLVLASANYSSNFPGFDGNVDIAETPSFDFSNTTNVSFSYDYSFARRTGVTADEFKLQYSTDCGGSWISINVAPTASVMAMSGGTVNSPYIPLSSLTTSTIANPKWKNKTIVSGLLSPVNNKRDVRFRFWFMNDPENGESQNLYIDNINISGTVGIHEFENSLGLAIYPNPTNSSATIEFTSPKDAKVNISVYDVTGRIIEENNINAHSGVNTKYSVNSSNRLKAGIYFVTLIIDNNKITKKLIIE